MSLSCIGAIDATNTLGIYVLPSFLECQECEVYNVCNVRYLTIYGHGMDVNGSDNGNRIINRKEIWLINYLSQ